MTLKRRFTAMASLVLLSTAAGTRATSVLPLSFDEITARSDTIVVVQAVNVRCDWQTSAVGKHIITIVRFKVERVLKGQVGPELQLEFLGGHIGGLVMGVDGMPAFKVGDRDVLFLSPNRKSVSPVIGLFQGRFRVERDRATGTDRIFTYNHQPFTAAQSSITVSRLLLAPTSRTGPLSYAQFEALVLNALAQGVAAK